MFSHLGEVFLIFCVYNRINTEPTNPITSAAWRRYTKDLVSIEKRAELAHWRRGLTHVVGVVQFTVLKGFFFFE